jgi:hypothetical protein
MIKRGVRVSSTSLTPSHFLACPKPETEFPTTDMGFFVFNDLR